MPRKKRASTIGKKRLDIRDVAKHARVSIATVSRTINGITTVDKELSQRVWKSIEALNYYPNTQARALVSGRSKLFGLLISEITNPFFPELIQGFEDVAVENGYEILIGSTNYDPSRMESCIRRMLERNVEGVAVMTFGVEAPLLGELASRDVPMVFVDMGPSAPRVSILSVNYGEGILQGVQHLAALGHRNIAFISGPLHQRSCQLRQNAFLESLDQMEIRTRPEWLLIGDHTLEGGMRCVADLIERRNLPTAIMCSNDMTAIGVLRMLIRSGIRVPEEISVIGFDDIHLAEFVYPPLTTVQMSRNALARGAFEALRRQVEEPALAAREHVFAIPTSLTVRQSTGFAPQQAASAPAPPQDITAASPRPRRRRAEE
jgi:DNA-binding LacI/PurR family transcriptional regulator